MKVILLTTRNHMAASISVQSFLKNTLLKKHGIEVVGIISANQFTSTKKQFQRLKNILKKSGLSFGLKLIILGFLQLIFVKINRVLKGERNRKYFEIDELAEKYKIPFQKTENINNEVCENFIKEKNPDYLVSCGLMQLVKKNILDLPNEGAINFHPSLIQEHRGTFSSFWALFRKNSSSGATIHFMTEKFDDGKVIVQKKFFVSPSDTLYSVDEKSARLGGNLLVQALVKLKKQKAKSILIGKLARMLSIPTPEDIQVVRKRREHIFDWYDIKKILGWKK